MLVTKLRTNRGFAGTFAAIVLLLASRIQLERNRPPGAMGASFDVATHQLATALVTVLVGAVVVIGMRVRHRRNS